MRLISLKVDSFRCVQKARIEFKPGLNVLHGPNDLGKSTLATAIRAVLLLTHSQREHESFIPWSEDAAPKVDLRFEMNGMGFYQVTKFFGDGNRGKSLLGTSKDGQDYAITTKGREVDEELRKLLRWGVPAPGGKAKSKGMPETFLTEVLMPEQSQVARVLELSLQQDPDDSGKARLTQALQAMATDPVFKQVFAAATAKVDAAYTPAGQRKRGKASPWTDARDRINELAREAERLRGDRVKSEEAENRVRSLSEQLDEARTRVDEAKARLAALEKRWQAKQARLGLEKELELARSSLAEVERLFVTITQTESQVTSLANEIEAGAKRLSELRVAVDACEVELKKAEDQKRTLESDSVEQARIVDRSRLEKKIAEFAAATAGIQGERERVAELQRGATALLEIEKRAKHLTLRTAQLGKEQTEASKVVEKAKLDLGELKQLDALARYLAAKKEYEANEALLEKAIAARQKVERLSGNAVKIRARLPRPALPNREQLEALRKLQNQLDVARAEVGLELSIHPDRAFEALISIDESERQTTKVETPIKVEARRSVRIFVTGIGEIRATAGRPEARADAERLGNRWQTEARPLLEAAGVTDVEALGKRIDEAEHLEREASGLEREIAASGAQLAEISVRDRDQLRSEMEDRERALGAADRNVLQAKLEKIGPDRLDLEEASQRQKLEHAARRATDLEVELAKLQTELARDQQEMGHQKEKLSPQLASLGAPPAKVLGKLDLELQGLRDQTAAATIGISALEGEARTAVVDAEKAIIAAQDQQTAKKAALEQTGAALDGLRQRHAGMVALLDERRRNAEAADRNAHQALVADLLHRVSEIAADPSLTELMVQEERKLLRREEELASSAEDELHAARGALEQVGGNVLKEQEADAQEVLHLAEHHQQDLDLEYEAWRRLVEALKQGESEQASHLGRALVEPISQRFAELTAGRYSRLGVGPNLETEHVLTEGGNRGLDLLSVGTRDQLATLIRLCLAERLGTCLILDDQLTQSDPERLGWVRELMYEMATRLQIIVLTCRPEDYVHRGADCHLVELSRCLNRSGGPRVLPEGSTRATPAKSQI